MHQYRLGVDYGTSHTVAVLRWPDGRTRPLLFDGAPLLPSAIYAAADGGLVVGRDAQHSARLDPTRFEPHPKRHIDDGEILLGARSVALVDLIAATLRRVADEAARTAGTPPTAVTITYPAAWAALRRSILVDAAARAGLPPPSLVPEPVAAAAYFASVLGHRVAVGQLVIVYDLGAGTFDVSALRRTPEGFDVLAVDGIADFGGLDLDGIVVHHVGATLSTVDPEGWQRLTSPTNPTDQRHFRSLWDDARTAKEMLSRQASAGLHVPILDRDAIISRDEFETAAATALDRATGLTVALMRQAGTTPDNLAGVFLVGGSSRIPLVGTALHRATGIAPTVLEQPEIVVAEGALHATAPTGPTSPHPMVPAPAMVPAPVVAPAAQSWRWPVRPRRRLRTAWLPILLVAVPLLWMIGVPLLVADLGWVNVDDHRQAGTAMDIRFLGLITDKFFYTTTLPCELWLAAATVLYARVLRWRPERGTGFIRRRPAVWVPGAALVALCWIWFLPHFESQLLPATASGAPVDYAAGRLSTSIAAGSLLLLLAGLVLVSGARWRMRGIVLTTLGLTGLAVAPSLWLDGELGLHGDVANLPAMTAALVLLAIGVALVSGTGYPRLVVDNDGLTYQPGRRWLFQLRWSELASAELRAPDPDAPQDRSILVASPVPGSPALTDPRLNRLWRPDLSGFVLDLARLRGIRQRRVSAAVARYLPGTAPGPEPAASASPSASTAAQAT